MTVVDAVVRKLADWPEDVACSVEAAQALKLAEDIDDPDTRPAARSMANKELRETMAALRALAPVVRDQDPIDDLADRRARRVAAS